MMRVPVAVEPQVKAIIDQYIESVLSDEKTEKIEPATCKDTDLCINLVDKFTKEVGISQSSFDKPTRDNQNLKRFVEWLEAL
jgi:hypothetical protein